MTVKALREALAGLPDDMLVLKYEPESYESGYVEADCNPRERPARMWLHHYRRKLGYGSQDEQHEWSDRPFVGNAVETQPAQVRDVVVIS